MEDTKETNTCQQTYSLRHSILNSTIVYPKEKQVTLQRIKADTEERRVHDRDRGRRNCRMRRQRQAHTEASASDKHMTDRSTEEEIAG